MSPKQDWVSKREISGLCKPKLMSSQQVQEPAIPQFRPPSLGPSSLPFYSTDQSNMTVCAPGIQEISPIASLLVLLEHKSSAHTSLQLPDFMQSVHTTSTPLLPQHPDKSMELQSTRGHNYAKKSGSPTLRFSKMPSIPHKAQPSLASSSQGAFALWFIIKNPGAPTGLPSSIAQGAAWL